MISSPRKCGSSTIPELGGRKRKTIERRDFQGPSDRHWQNARGSLHGLVGSMSHRGNPYDNAKAESFMDVEGRGSVSDGLRNIRGRNRRSSPLPRRGLQSSEAPLCARLSKPRAVRRSPRPAEGQNRSLILSGLRGALRTSYLRGSKLHAEIQAFIQTHAPRAARVGLESGPTSPWLWQGCRDPRQRRRCCVEGKRPQTIPRPCRRSSFKKSNFSTSGNGRLLSRKSIRSAFL